MIGLKTCSGRIDLEYIADVIWIVSVMAPDQTGSTRSDWNIGFR